MHRPFNRVQQLQNAAFLRELAKTGNARAAARALGLNRSMLTKRRAKSPAFAARWDAALTLAHARLNEPPRNGKRGGGGSPRSASAATPRIIHTSTGRLQLRAPGRARRLTPAAEQTFLAALSATANIRLSAKAAGYAHSTFYALARRDPGFAREMREALEIGYERLECALIESFDPSAHNRDAWRHNDPPPIPSMTPAQALQLLYLNQKAAIFWTGRPDRERKRRESWDQWSERMGRKWVAAREAQDEAYWAEQAALHARAAGEFEPPAPVVPALDQVTGWSKASGKKPHNPDRALFGGWRITDWEGD